MLPRRARSEFFGAAGLLAVCAFLGAVAGSAETFLNPYRIPTTSNPSSVAVADLNGDGLQDIVYGDSSTSPQGLHVLLAQRGGGYSPAPTITLPASVLSVCRLLDTNRDGRPDLVCPYQNTFAGALVILLGNGDGTFAAPTTFALPTSTGNFADLIVSSPMDLNSDGIPDLIVGDAQNAVAYVLLGDGQGSFRLASKLGSYTPPVAADVNGDGKPDLLYPNAGVMLGNGDGTFGPYKVYSQTFDYDNLCVYADMDGDGHLDAVCGYGEAPSGDIDGVVHLIILHGNADGSFNPTPIVDQLYGNRDTEYDGYGTFYYPLAIYDVNGDGIKDILSYSADGYGVLLAQPGLKFSAPQHYAASGIASSNSFSATFADMNGDGLVDIVASGTNGVYISYGKKDGSFATARAFEVAQTLGNATFGDFNGDGVPDVAATGDTAIQLSLGNGDGTFAAYQPLANNGINFSGIYPSATAGILNGDFNGDGKQDLFAVGSAGSNINSGYIYFGRGNGSFAPPYQVPNTSTYYNASPGAFVQDVNKDGLDDFVNADVSGTVLPTLTPIIYVSLSNGDGSFRTVVTKVPVEVLNSSFNQPVSNPALADFDHDGKLDAVVGEQANAYVLKGHGDGSFDSTGTILPIPTIPGLVNTGTSAIATGDFDGDGNQDIAVLYQLSVIKLYYAFQYGSAVFVYYGKGDGTFSAPVTLGRLDHDYAQIIAADLNGDGLTDLVLRNAYNLYDPPSMSVLHAKAGRSFAPEVNYTVGVGLYQAAAVDVNRDGFPDLLFANNLISGSYPNSVTVLLNQGNAPAVTGTLTASPEPSTAGQAFALTATLTPPSPGTLAGSVAFSIDGTPVGSAPLLANLATVSIPGTLAVGSHTLSATWPGDTTYAPLTLMGNHVVIGIPTVTTLVSSQNPASYGQTLAFTATVAGVSTGSGTPTGFVSFRDGVTVLAMQPLGTGGGNMASASFSTSALAVGSHPITATYMPTGGFSGSSATLTETINPLTSAVSLTAAPNPAFAGQLVGIMAAVTGASTTPTGAVTFYDGGAALASVQVDGAGHAAFATSTLAVGTHSLSAVYAGNAIYATSSSAPFSETIQPNPADFTIALATPTLTIQTQHHATTSVSLASLNGFADTLALSCANLPQYVTCQLTPATATLTANGRVVVSLYIDTDSVIGYAGVRPGADRVWRLGSPVLLALLLPLSWIPGRGRRRGWQAPGLALAMAAMTVGLGGCGTIILPVKVPPSAAPGTYTIPITAAGTVTVISHTAQLTLIVTP